MRFDEIGDGGRRRGAVFWVFFFFFVKQVGQKGAEGVREALSLTEG